jgi:hypothetical protein
MSQREYNDSYGTLRIGQVSAVDTVNFTCDVNFGGSYSGATKVPLSTHPSCGTMPSSGDTVMVYDHPGYGKRFLGSLYEDEGLTVEQIQERPATPGLVMNLNEGEAYIGRWGRAHFDNQGNARIQSQAARSGLELKHEKAVAELFGVNFDHYTSGKNVRIHTSSSTPLTWGDSISIEVNNPIAPGNDSAPEVIPSNLGRLVISNTGTVNIDVLPLTPTPLNLDMSIDGSVFLGRLVGPITPVSVNTKTAGLSMSPLDDMLMFNTKGYLLVDRLGNVEGQSSVGLSTLTLSKTGDVTLKNPLGKMLIDASGNISLTGPAAKLDILQTGSFEAASPGAYSLGMSPVGDLIYTGKSVDISATGPVFLGGTVSSVLGSGSVNLVAPFINLGGVTTGHVAFAEAMVLVLQRLNLLHQLIRTHSHAVQGAVITGLGVGGSVTGLASPSTELAPAATIPPVPTAAQIGSTTVAAQA